MPIPTPAGYVSTHLDKLAVTLSKSSTFQTLVGAANEAAAYAKIVRITSSSVERPRAIIGYGDRFRKYRSSTSGSHTKGELLVLIEYDVPSTYVPAPPAARDDDGALADYFNTIGSILDDMAALTNPSNFTDGCLEYDWAQPDGEDFAVDEDTSVDFIWGAAVFWVGGSE